MRIRTDGDKAHRKDVIEEAQRALDENTKTAAIIAACEHARQDVERKEDALEYLTEHVRPEVVREVAERLSTREVQLDVDVETNVRTE